MLNLIRLAVVSVVVMASTHGYAWIGVAHRVSYSHCSRDSHTEAYPRNRHWKRAYGCKSDQAGYLEGRAQGDEPGN